MGTLPLVLSGLRMQLSKSISIAAPISKRIFWEAVAALVALVVVGGILAFVLYVFP